MIYLYVTPSGSVNLIEGDKMPDSADYAENFQDGSGTGRYDAKGYEDALKAAKASSILCSDQEKAKELCFDALYETDGDHIRTLRGTIYGPFDIGYEIKEVDCQMDDCWISSKCCHKDNCHSNKVAILLPEKEPVKQRSHTESNKLRDDIIAILEENPSPMQPLYPLLHYFEAKLKGEPVGKLEPNTEGKKYAISERFIQDAKSYFEGSSFPYTYSREEAEEIYASAAQHGFDSVVCKLEEKEIKPGEPFTVDGRRYVIVNTSSASESSNLENGQNIFILKSVGSL